MNKLTLTDLAKESLRENPEKLSTWLKGLRSGKYDQYVGGMCGNNMQGSACCLHVLEMEANGTPWSEGLGCCFPSEIDSASVQFGGILAEDLEAIFEGDRYVEYVGDNCLRPSAWNDNLGLTFNQIADLIEFGEIEWEGTIDE